MASDRDRSTWRKLLNDNQKFKLNHPLVLKAAAACKKCGYELGRSTIESHKDAHTGEKVTTTKVIMAHKNKDIPLAMHAFIAKHMTPVTPLNKTHYSNATREVVLHGVAKKDGGHELHFHSIRYGK